MGFVSSTSGEAREADLGVASGNGKGQISSRVKGIKTVPEAQIVETLIRRPCVSPKSAATNHLQRFTGCDRKLRLTL